MVLVAQRTRLKNRADSSGGKTRYGRTRKDVNRYLKWAYSEAANVVARHRQKHPERHVSRLYERIMGRKKHQKAIGAVGRLLAEATYWMLKKGEPLVSKQLREERAELDTRFQGQVIRVRALPR